MNKDYRDKLQELLGELHSNEGVTRYRISKKSGISEQTISNVMHKRRNLSIEALEKLLESIGYEIQFVRASIPTTTVGTGSSMDADISVLHRSEVPA